MNLAQKIVMLVGGIFAAVGICISVIFIIVFGGLGPFILIPLIFPLIGVCMIIPCLISYALQKRIIKNGKKYPAKIYGYVEDRSVLVNEDYLVNTKVHFFDDRHVEREVIIPTKFTKGSSDYPIGMTIDIYEYKGKYQFDKKSVRGELIPGEEELMDDKPVSPEMINYIGVKCPNCASSFKAAAGYASKCPYCDSYVNV